MREPLSGPTRVRVTVYTPLQDPAEIVELMRGLESFMNDDTLFAVDPLIKMALVHHQFESIHPFYDGNGRTGRIVNVLIEYVQRDLQVSRMPCMVAT